MKKIIFVLIALGLVAGLIYVIADYANKEKSDHSNSYSVSEIVSGSADIQIKQKADKDLAIAKAKELWRAKFIMEEDLSNGPCLSNEVVPDWVADIAHNPRQEVDDLLLDIFRHRGENAVAVNCFYVFFFRLKKNSVLLLISESDDLGLDAGAVARVPGGYLA